jgi:hypothetical protein
MILFFGKSAQAVSGDGTGKKFGKAAEHGFPELFYRTLNYALMKVNASNGLLFFFRLW